MAPCVLQAPARPSCYRDGALAMRMATVRPKRRTGVPDSSPSRFDTWARAEICALNEQGVPQEEIQERVLKKDGEPATYGAIHKVIRKKRQNPEWRGEDSSAGGKPPSLTTAEKRKLLELVFRERGKAVVTAKYCRKRLLFLRKVSPRTVSRALGEAGLAWLRRRSKRAVPPTWRTTRVAFCKWLLARTRATLVRWA